MWGGGKGKAGSRVKSIVAQEAARGGSGCKGRSKVILPLPDRRHLGEAKYVPCLPTAQWATRKVCQERPYYTIQPN